jgi:uncharacterized protein (TIGR02453 family)
MNKQHFTPDALQFLRELALHNERPWFETQRERFAASLRDPFVAFLVDLKPRLADVNAGFVVDSRTHGGSLARIHRDMRFAVDGQPYKTALSAHFAHDDDRRAQRSSSISSPAARAWAPAFATRAPRRRRR